MVPYFGMMLAYEQEPIPFSIHIPVSRFFVLNNGDASRSVGVCGACGLCDDTCRCCRARRRLDPPMTSILPPETKRNPSMTVKIFPALSQSLADPIPAEVNTEI